MAQNTRTDDPPNLLTIPREIRQKILYYTLFTSLAEDISLARNIMLLNQVSISNHTLQSFARQIMSRIISAPHISNTAHVLNRIHPTICSELPFVVHQRLDEFDNPNNWPRKEGDEEMRKKGARWMGAMVATLDRDLSRLDTGHLLLLAAALI